MRYHLCKHTRNYDGSPYCGTTSGDAPAESDDLEAAKSMANIFDLWNPVWWDVYDSATGELVWPIVEAE